MLTLCGWQYTKTELLTNLITSIAITVKPKGTVQQVLVRVWESVIVNFFPSRSKHEKVQISAYLDTETQYANFQGNPLCQATKQYSTVSFSLIFHCF